MKVSVIIPVYNAQETIEECLESIITQERSPEQVILIDNGSSDETVARIKSFADKNKGSNILLLSEQKRGAAAARNKGLQYAEGDIIAFVDSDCLSRQDWLKNMLGLYERDEVDAIGGITYIYNPKTCSQKLEALDLVIPDELRGAVLKMKYETLFGKIMGTFNCSCKKEALEKIGGFDDSLNVAGEDIDLTIRIFEQGFKVVVWHPDMVVRHMPRKTYGLFLKKIFQYRLALAILLRKHFRKEAFIEIPRIGVKKINFLTAAVVTKEFLASLFFLILAAILHKAIALALALGLAIVIIRILRSIFRKRKIISFRISLYEIPLIISMDIIKKVISEFAKVYSGIRNKSFYL